MSDSHGHSRVCPTRIDGGAALFTHRVTVPQCEERQRGRYHKCYSCSHNRDLVEQNGVAPTRVSARPAAAPRPTPVPPAALPATPEQPQPAPERISTAARA